MEKTVLELLQATLFTTSNEERKRAGKTLESLKKQKGYCTSLCSIALAPSIPLDTRHLATILLRNMIDKNWGLSNNLIQQERLKLECNIRREFAEVDEDGRETDPSAKEHEQILIEDDEKESLRVRLDQGLCIPEMKMKVQFSLMISTLVKYDFPHQMPNLLGYLVKQIQEHTPAEQGAALCLEIIIHPDFLFDGDQMLNITEKLMPFILEVYENTGGFTENTRKSMVMILFSIVNWVVNRRVEREGHNEVVMVLLKSYLSRWITQFIKDLSGSQDIPLRICILQVLCLLVYSMPLTLIQNQYIHALLPIVWQLFVSLQETYVKGAVLSDSLYQSASHDIDFNCGNVYYFDSLILLLLEFFHAVLDRKEMASLLLSSLTETTYVLVSYMQFSSKQTETFEFEEDQFVLNERGNKYGAGSLTIRSSAARLFSELLARHKTYPDLSILDQSLRGIVMRLQETSQDNTEQKWALRESSIFACSKGLRYFLKYNQDFIKTFPDFLSSLQGDLRSSNVLLSSRAFLCFAKSLAFHLASIENYALFYEFASASICGMELSPRWIASALGMQKILKHVELSSQPPNMSNQLQALAHFAGNGLQSESLLLCLDTMITYIRRIDTAALDVDTVRGLILCALKLWQLYSQDSYISSYVLDILQAIVSHPTERILEMACTEGVPLIQQVLNTPDLESEKATAIDLLQILITASSLYPRPINEQGSILGNLLTACFPSLLKLLMEVPLEADLILSSGATCFFSIFNDGMKKRSFPGGDISSLNEQQIQHLLPGILQFASRLLGFDVSDIVCMDIGPVLSILLIQCPESITSSEESYFSLLFTTVSRVLQAKFFDTQQNLLAVIARLICMKTDPAIQFLHAKGQLIPLVTFWVQEYSQFCDPYIGKLSLRCFQHFLLSPVSQPILGSIPIQVQTERASRRSLRSSTQQVVQADQWKNVPSHRRLTQLLIGEYLSAIVEQNHNQGGSDEDGFFESDSEGSYNEDNEWDPTDYGDCDDGNLVGIDSFLDGGYDDDDDGLSSVLVKCDPLTTPATLKLLEFILSSVKQQFPSLFQAELSTFSPEEQQFIHSLP